MEIPVAYKIQEYDQPLNCVIAKAATSVTVLFILIVRYS